MGEVGEVGEMVGMMYQGGDRDGGDVGWGAEVDELRNEEEAGGGRGRGRERELSSAIVNE